MPGLPVLSPPPHRASRSCKTLALVVEQKVIFFAFCTNVEAYLRLMECPIHLWGYFFSRQGGVAAIQNVTSTSSRVDRFTSISAIGVLKLTLGSGVRTARGCESLQGDLSLASAGGHASSFDKIGPSTNATRKPTA